MRIQGLLVISFLLLFSGSLIAQKKTIVGTWKLVSATTTTLDGIKNKTPYGNKPNGVLTYTAEGRMNVIISYDGRKRLSGADRIASPPEERAEAFSTSFAYAGSYTISGQNLIHHVEISSVENW